MHPFKSIDMRTIKYLLLLFFPLSMTMSCKKFLDVRPDDQVLQEKLFETNEGVRIAVNGVYRLLSSPEVYGKNLSWGWLSAVSQNYEVNYLPWEVSEAARFNWEITTTQSIMESVWKRSYNILANVNNIIQEVEKKDSSFFKEKGWEKNMILGEMHGIRGMVHFDLLRIFSPAPVTGYAGETIPYVSAYPTYQPERLTMSALFDRIVTDLQQAQTLLANVDTIYLRTIMRNVQGRVRSNFGWFDLPQGDFFNFRAQRMNFFAATGMLARVYMYKGDFANGEVSARLVYDLQKKNWLQWTQAFNQGQINDVDYVYTKRPSELMLCFSNAKNYDIYEEAINAGGAGSLYYTMNDTYIGKLFEGDLDDYRLVGWYNRYNDMRYLTWARPRGNSYNADVVLRDQGPLLPVMRFTEMYHILIECYARAGRINDAVTILNDLRLRRGAKVKILNTVSADELMDILVKDVVRENLTEGQAFFLFKRLNRNIFNGETDRIMNPKDWYAPLPQSEVAYQL
jgi:starch-binding outer membrane protein, SusD/RagB family